METEIKKGFIKKILIVILCLIYCNFSFAITAPEKGFSNKNPKYLKNAVSKKKGKTIVFFQTNSCYTQYLNAEQNLGMQAVPGYRNCQLSNQIVENFDLAGCNASVNNVFQHAQAFNSIILNVCYALSYIDITP